MTGLNIKIVIGVIVVIAIYGFGWKTADWYYQAMHKDHLESVIQEYETQDKKRLERAEELEGLLAKERQNERVRYVTREKIIRESGSGSCGAGSDGLQYASDREASVNAARLNAYGLPASKGGE